MKVIYSKTIGKEKDVLYRTEFLGVVSSATEVVVDGDFPNVEDVYKNLGVKVTKQSTRKTAEQTTG